MISVEEALEIAERFVAEHCVHIEGGGAIVPEHTIEKSYGWVFFYNSRRFLETGNFLEALGGNGPLVVERADGRVHTLSSGQSPEVSIAEFERARGARWSAAVTAGSPIVLIGSTGSLMLALDEKGVGGWCQVHLLVAGVGRPLGAERLNYIATHLGVFLADPAPSRRWVLSLSERHTSLYGEHVAGETIIELQDGDAKWFANLVLTPTERSEWVRQLSQHSGP